MDFKYFRAQTDKPDEPFFNYTEVSPLFSKVSDDADEGRQVEIKADNIAEEKLFQSFIDNLPKYEENLTYVISEDKVILDGIVHRRHVMRVARGEPYEREISPPKPLYEEVQLPNTE